MDKPVRKVRSNGKTVVGLLSSAKNKSVQFESSLEESFLYLLSFDDDVKTFFSQPEKIPFQDRKGIARNYVPDFLVEYHDRPPVLFEVKSEKWIKENYDLHCLTNQAAQDFAGGKGWSFQVFTDKRLKTDFALNIKFLFRFQEHPVTMADEKFILDKLTRGGLSVQALVNLAGDNGTKVLATIWSMLFCKKLSANLKEKLTMQTRVRINTDGQIKKAISHDTIQTR